MKLKSLRFHTYANRQLPPDAVYSVNNHAHAMFLVSNGFAERFEEQRDPPTKREILTKDETTGKKKPRKRRARKQVEKKDAQSTNQPG